MSTDKSAHQFDSDPAPTTFGSTLEVPWDEELASWEYLAGPAGPAGSTSLRFEELQLEFDSAYQDRVLRISVEPALSGEPVSLLAQAALEWLGEAEPTAGIPLHLHSDRLGLLGDFAQLRSRFEAVLWHSEAVAPELVAWTRMWDLPVPESDMNRWLDATGRVLNTVRAAMDVGAKTRPTDTAAELISRLRDDRREWLGQLMNAYFAADTDGPSRHDVASLVEELNNFVAFNSVALDDGAVRDPLMLVDTPSRRAEASQVAIGAVGGLIDCTSLPFGMVSDARWHMRSDSPGTVRVTVRPATSDYHSRRPTVAVVREDDSDAEVNAVGLRMDGDETCWTASFDVDGPPERVALVLTVGEVPVPASAGLPIHQAVWWGLNAVAIHRKAAAAGAIQPKHRRRLVETLNTEVARSWAACSDVWAAIASEDRAYRALEFGRDAATSGDDADVLARLEHRLSAAASRRGEASEGRGKRRRAAPSVVDVLGEFSSTFVAAEASLKPPGNPRAAAPQTAHDLGALADLAAQLGSDAFSSLSLSAAEMYAGLSADQPDLRGYAKYWLAQARSVFPDVNDLDRADGIDRVLNAQGASPSEPPV